MLANIPFPFSVFVRVCLFGPGIRVDLASLSAPLCGSDYGATWDGVYGLGKRSVDSFIDWDR